MGQASGEAGRRLGLQGPPLAGSLLACSPAPLTSAREGQGSASSLTPSSGREGSGPQPTAWEGAMLPWPSEGLPSPRCPVGIRGHNRMHSCRRPGKLVRRVRELSEGFGFKHS